MRTLTWLNPYDEILYRVLTGRVAAAVERSLDTYDRVVVSNRLVSVPPAWNYARLSEAYRERKANGLAIGSAFNCRALLKLDVKDYYPSLRPTVLASVLRRIQAPEGAVEMLEAFLDGLEDLQSAPGIPIGPEGSGVLGNAALLDVDRALQSLTIGMVRYTDDTWAFLDDPAKEEAVVEVYEEALGDLGLRPNHDKTALLYSGDPEFWETIVNSRVDYFSSEYFGSIREERAVQELAEEMESDDPDWKVVRFALGALRTRRVTAGVDVVIGHPKLLTQEPTSVGRYLYELASDPATASAVDQDWLVSQATATPNSATVVGQLHLCRVAERLGVGTGAGNQLAKMALDFDLHDFLPLQVWAAYAWGASGAFEVEKAFDCADHVGDFNLRRAFALTARGSDLSRGGLGAAVERLRRVEPDLAPTLSYLSR